MSALSLLIADDVVWHTPGRNLDVRVVLLCEIRAQQIVEAFATPLDQHAFDSFFADIS